MKEKMKLKSEYKKKIYIAKQTINYERKEINKRLLSLEIRRAAIRKINKTKAAWKNLEEKYKLTEQSLLHRTMAQMDDAPRFKGKTNWRFYWTYRIRDRIF